MKREAKIEVTILIEPITLSREEWFHMSQEERMDMIDNHIADGGFGYKYKSFIEDKT